MSSGIGHWEDLWVKNAVRVVVDIVRWGNFGPLCNVQAEPDYHTLVRKDICDGIRDVSLNTIKERD